MLGGQHSFGRIKVDSMKVPRFTGSDFNIWRMNMEMFLEAAEVCDLVCGEEPEPIVSNGGIVLMGKSFEVEGREADLKVWRKKNLDLLSQSRTLPPIPEGVVIVTWY